MPLLRRDLIDLFGRACDLGNAALFVGAGLSIGAGLPSWTKLLEEPRSESEVPAIEDLPLMAEYILSEGRYSRSRLEQHILDATAAADFASTPALEHLVRLPVDQIWTTNYDPLIERTGPQSGVRVIATDDDIRLIGTSERSIVKMHGSVNASTPAAWLSPPVITRTDYETYETEHPLRPASTIALSSSRQPVPDLHSRAVGPDPSTRSSADQGHAQAGSRRTDAFPRPVALDGQVGVLDGLQVSGGAGDAESEQVADAADVATSGVDLVEDPVLAQRLRTVGRGSGIAARETVE